MESNISAQYTDLTSNYGGTALANEIANGESPIII